VSEPCCTSAAIVARHASSVLPTNITALIRLDLNRAIAQVTNCPLNCPARIYNRSSALPTSISDQLTTSRQAIYCATKLHLITSFSLSPPFVMLSKRKSDYFSNYVDSSQPPSDVLSLCTVFTTLSSSFFISSLACLHIVSTVDHRGSSSSRFKISDSRIVCNFFLETAWQWRHQNFGGRGARPL